MPAGLSLPASRCPPLRNLPEIACEQRPSATFSRPSICCKATPASKTCCSACPSDQGPTTTWRENEAALLLVSHDREVLGQFDHVGDFHKMNRAFAQEMET